MDLDGDQDRYIGTRQPNRRGVQATILENNTGRARRKHRSYGLHRGTFQAGALPDSGHVEQVVPLHSGARVL